MLFNQTQFKKGVALVTVLLFMMMATIGATAVYKWLSSENKASAARLKQSEAYQASQAGINAARAWLAFNGNETGALVTQFVNDLSRTPISLDSRLTPMNSGLQQNFSVMLTDVDVTASPIKVKIISTGTGRDNSRFSQVAILSVEGLYQIPLPSDVATTAYEYAYFGGSINYASDHHATSMVINGNWTGNPSTVDKDFIVTGNVNLSGSNMKVGDNACIGGTLDETGADKVSFGSIYVAGDADLSNGGGTPFSINGNAYFDGNFVTTNGFSIAENLTINRGFFINMAAGGIKTIQGNMCTGENGYVNFTSEEGEGSDVRFTVLGNVWMPNEGSLTGKMPSSEKLMEHRTFGAKKESEIYMAGTYQDSVKTCATDPSKECYYYHQEGDFFSELYGMITGTYNWRYFTTNADQRSSVAMGNAPFSCGSEIKDYCDSKWEKKTGCNGAKYMVEDMLATAYDHFENKANKVSCATSITRFADNSTSATVDALNVCYETAVANDDPNLYNGYLVVKFSANTNATPQGTLKGKFIIIYEDNAGTLKLPPSEGVTMVYLKNGAGDVIQSVSGGTYNYFFYAKKDIAQLLEGSSPWSGSIYAEAASCAKVGNVQGGVNLEYNAEVLNDLIQAKVVCNAEAGECGEDESDESGSSSSGDSDEESSKKNDSHWIALSPTLKISLASQYANEESIRHDPAELNPSLLVMPRIIYLTVDERLVEGDDKNYRVVYLGGLEPSGSGSADCYYGSRYGSGNRVDENSPFEEIGLHSCRYTEGNYHSDFWVWVSDKATSSKVGFDTLQYNLGKQCEEDGTRKKEVKLKLISGTRIMPGSLNIYVYNSSIGATVTAMSSSLFELTGPSSVGGYDVYKLTITQENLTSLEDPLFEVELPNGCAAATGFVQFQLEDINFNDGLTIGSPNNEVVLFGEGSARVFHRPIEDDLSAPADITERPDCTIQENSDASWGAFYGTNASNGCIVVEDEFDSYSGPWLCPLGSSVKAKASNEDLWNEECELWQSSDVIIDGTGDVYVYASLKKKQFILHVEIEGLQGEADAYSTPTLPDLTDEDAEIEVYTPDDVLMGTCKSGNRGTCDYKVYYGQHYYVRAKGKYFDHWTYDCFSKSETNNCGTSIASRSSKTIAITTKENVTVQANYTKTGYCFNEDFKHLHPYCDEEVTVKAIGGLTQARSSNKPGEYYRADVKNNPEKIDYSESLMGDYAHGDGEYCIDQCVTNWRYRYSELVAAQGKVEIEGIGTAYDYYYDYYCSTEGRTIEGSVKEKEDEVWSYYDPGISCYDMVDRAFDDWKMPWTTNINFTYYKQPNVDEAKKIAKAKCGSQTENPDSYTYRCINDKAETVECRNTDKKKYHPASLDKPRVYGGYYPQNDRYSPWIKILGVNLSQQTKLGSRRAPENKTIINDNGESKTVKLSMWNVKPYIDRDEGFISMHGFKTSYVMLRKQKAGYNGTFTKTFTWDGTGEKGNDGGSVSAIVFRSNADASSFFLLGINPSASTGDATQQHFILCHGNERLSYPDSSQLKLSGSQDANDARELQSPLTQGHCVKEDVFANIPWNQIQKKTLQLKVELEGPMATITFAYSNDLTSNVGTGTEIFDGTNSTIYIKKEFNLEDPALFGYPIPDDRWSDRIPKKDFSENSTHIYQDPITHMKNHNEDYGYVGFIVHNQYEKTYNLNWRSGGSCGGEYRDDPGVYCGFETPELPAGSHQVPVRYMYDFCPDGGECKCEYEYNIDDEPTWHSENSFILPGEPRKYPYGTLKVRASCVDQNDPANRKTIVEKCNGFTTYDENNDNKCYDDYTIFNTYSKAEDIKVFRLYDSEIANLDNNYVSKINQYAINIANLFEEDGDAIRRSFCKDVSGYTAGESHYNATGYCSNKKSDDAVSKAHDVNGNMLINEVNTRVHPAEFGINKNANLETGKLMLIGKPPFAEADEGVIINYLQLTDTIDNTNKKDYLNLKGSDITFRLYQNNLIDDIQMYLQDADGVVSERFSIDDLVDEYETDEFNNSGSLRASKAMREAGTYCDIYDNQISTSEYNALSLEEKEHYRQSLCQLGLVWVRDLKRLAREASDEPGHTWYKLYPYRNIKASVQKFVGATSFDPSRVKRIYFELHNDRGGGIHISQLKSECPTSLDVRQCQTSINNVDYATNDRTFREGLPLYVKAKVDGANLCRLEIRQDGSNMTYTDIKGPEFTEEDGFATPWFSCNGIMEKNVTLTCDNDNADINCVGRLTVVAKNTSNEEVSCKNATGGATTIKITVQNTKYICYGYNFDYTTPSGTTTPAVVLPSYTSNGYVTALFDAGSIEYGGSGTISMGIDFNNYSGLGNGTQLSPRPTIQLQGPDGQTIQELLATDSHPNNDVKFERCAQRQDGKIWVKKNSNGTFNSYQNISNHCAFFQFNPEEYGSGDYTLVLKNSNMPACKINVDVPLANIVNGSCAITPGSTVAKGATIQITATGTNLSGSGLVKIGGTEHECTFDEANSVISCNGITAPTEKGTYDVELTYNGRKTTCPSLTVADKPTVKSCDVLDGKFVAKVDNPASVTYNYRLIRCANLLGMGCTVETEGRELETGLSSAISILLPRAMSSIQDGKDYTYVFQVSTSSDFPEDNVSYCPANPSNSREDGFREESADRDMTLECGFTTTTAAKGGNVKFYVKNAHGFTSSKSMNLESEGGTSLGSISVKNDGSVTEQTLTIPGSVKAGEKYTVKLFNGASKVCEARVDIVPVTAECVFASSASNVKKGSEYYQGFEVYNVQGLANNQNMTLKYGETEVNTGCYVEKDPSKTSKCNVKIPATAKSGTQKFTLVYDGDVVCEASTNVLPITADCKIIKLDWPYDAVSKAIAKTNVKLQLTNIQNVGGAINAKFKREGGGDKSLSLNPWGSDATSPTAFGVPDLTGSVTYNVYDETGDVICSTPAVNVVQPSIECKVANDNDSRPENTTTIMNSNHTPNTHFYFYVKYTGEPTTSFVVTSPWNGHAAEYDVQGDAHSYYSEGCGSHNASGYNCVTVYPSYNTSGGFTAQTTPYHYIYYADYSSYYGGTKLKCQRDVNIR